MPSFILNKLWFLLENVPLFNLVSFLLAIFGLIATFILYFRSKRQRLPTYAVKSINLVENNIEKLGGVKISYAGLNVKNLSVARLALWNSGRETINLQDAATNAPLKIVCSGSTNFLEIVIIYEKNSANNFSLTPVYNLDKPKEHKQNEMLINFDYFDKNEGVILQIFHTGKTGDEIKIEGTIKGAGVPKKVGAPLFRKINILSIYLEKLNQKHRKIILGGLLLLTPILAIVLEFIPKPKIENNFWNKYLPFIILVIIYWTMGFSILRKRVPKGFELFEESLKP